MQARQPILMEHHPPWAFIRYPQNSRDIGTSRWQLGDESRSALSPDEKNRNLRNNTRLRCAELKIPANMLPVASTVF
jgi:hypothetical protein